MKSVLSLTARLRLMALFVTLAILGLAVYTGYAFHGTALDMRLSATRAVVQQSVGIAQRYHDLEKSGQLSTADAQAKAAAEVRAIRYEGKEYVWINDMSARMIAHPIKPELDGKDLSDFKDPTGKRLFVEFVEVIKRSGSGYVDYLWPKPGSKEPEPKRSYVAGFAPWGWVVGSGVYVDEVRQAALQFAAVSLGVGLAVGVIVFVFVQRLAGSMQRRLRDAEGALQAIASGDLTAAIDAGRLDEIGRLVQAVGRTRDGLSNLVAQVRASTDSISTASNEIASGNQDLSARTEQAASSLQQTASSMEQLTGTVKQTADSAHTANQLASSASVVAERGGKVVGQVVSTMNEINSSSKKIADIIGEITAASSEQSSGIGQVNVAVTQLDQMTQQNAALVEESAAAAESLKGQAHKLASVVSSFRVDARPQAAAPVVAPPVQSPKPAVPAPAKKPVLVAPAAVAAHHEDWETF